MFCAKGEMKLMKEEHEEELQELKVNNFFILEHLVSKSESLYLLQI